MTIRFSKKYVKEYKKLPQKIRGKVDIVIEQLPTEITNLRKSGMGIRKMVNHKDIYELRVDIQYRITFQKQKKWLVLRRVGTHEIYQNP